MVRAQTTYEAIMHRGRRVVTIEQIERSGRLPDFMTEGAVLLQHLVASGKLSEMAERLQLTRQGGYHGVDAVVLFITYFAAGLGIGLKDFIDRIRKQRRELGLLGGRRLVPSQASTSRLLSAVEEKDCETFGPWLLREGSEADEILRHPAALARDGLGRAWQVFDLDPTSTVVRQRALPEGKDLPAAKRRAHEARPGYNGRKRGEVKLSRTTLQHAGSGVWLGIWTGPGNGDWRPHSRAAVEVVTATCTALGHSPKRALVRVDGAGGNTPFITACQEAGICFVTRGWPYQLLDEPELRRHLNEVDWYEVEDSRSGPCRQAAELGRFELPCAPNTVREDGSPYQKVCCRLVISRYRAESDRGVGRLIEGWKYELFATDLEVEAWSAAEVVTCYYGRTGEENRFGQEDRELGLDRIFSYHIPGQHLANLIGLFEWNLRIVRGMATMTVPKELPAQLSRTAVPVENPVKLPETTADTSSDVPNQPDGFAYDVRSAGGHAEAVPAGDAGLPGACAVGAEKDEDLFVMQQANSTLRAGEVEEGTSKETTRSIPEPDARPPSSLEATEQRLWELLEAQNWLRLLRRQPGWNWSRDDFSLRCPNGRLASLTSAKLFRSGVTGQLRFVLSFPECRNCPLRSGCTDSDAPTFRKELAVTVQGEVASQVHALLAATRGHEPRIIKRKTDRLEPPVIVRAPENTFLAGWERPDHGRRHAGLVPISAPLLPATLRHAFSKASRDVEVHVHVGPVRLPDRSRALAESPADRQHQRATWHEKLTYNQLPPDTDVWIRFLTTAPLPSGTAMSSAGPRMANPT